MDKQKVHISSSQWSVDWIAFTSAAKKIQELERLYNKGKDEDTSYAEADHRTDQYKVAA